MHDLKAELIADKFVRFWMFPKGFYHTRLRVCVVTRCRGFSEIENRKRHHWRPAG